MDIMAELLNQPLIVASLAISLLPLLLVALILLTRILKGVIRALRAIKLPRMRRTRARARAYSDTDDTLADEMLDLAAFARPMDDEIPPEQSGETPTAEAQPDATPPAVQSILSSVFAGDEQSDAYAVLLEDAQPIDIDDLALMADDVARGLDQLAGKGA